MFPLVSNYFLCLFSDVEENYEDYIRPYHGKDGCNHPPAGDQEHQRLASRSYHHGHQGAAGYLPGFPQQKETRLYGMASLKRH